jgi:hypothetical protein
VIDRLTTGFVRPGAARWRGWPLLLALVLIGAQSAALWHAPEHALEAPLGAITHAAGATAAHASKESTRGGTGDSADQDTDHGADHSADHSADTCALWHAASAGSAPPPTLALRLPSPNCDPPLPAAPARLAGSPATTGHPARAPPDLC